jgi:Tol biopolymer transport system component
MKPAIVDFDCEISADGNTLYFSEGLFTGGSVPKSARIMIALRNGNSFTRDPNGKRILRKINNGQRNYAADTSVSGLEIFFTRLTKGRPAIYMATRASTSKAFGKPVKIKAITGFAEAPSISPDDRSLYFHKKNASGIFSIYRVTRP